MPLHVDKSTLLPMRHAGFLERAKTRLFSPAGGNVVSTRQSLTEGYEAIAHRHRAEALLLGVQYIVHAFVEGDIAEFGTYTGQTAEVLARGMKMFRVMPEVKLHLFDSFDGMPKASHAADAANPHVKSGVWAEGQYRCVGEAELAKRCGKFHRFHSIQTHKGWFTDTLAALPGDTRFALVHLDCDLYSSTRDVLASLFGRGLLSKGAMLLFDDWNCAVADDQHGQRKAFSEACGEHAAYCEDFGTYSWGSKRFIVHDYNEMK